MTPENELATRGIQNSKVIDLISLDSGNEVVLTMLEQRPWDNVAGQLAELESKFNSYLDYAIDGWLEKQYPQYRGKAVRVELRSNYPFPEELRLPLQALQRCCQQFGLSFRSVVDPGVATSVAEGPKS